MRFLQYGAGNIGRGFLGQIFSRSGYEVVFVDVNRELVDKLNSDHSYPVTVISNNGKHEETVRNVRAVHGLDTEAVVEEIAAADVMATAVGVNIIHRITPVIAQGIKKRFAGGNLNPLNIIICENLIDANHYMERLIKEHLSPEEAKLFDNRIGLVEASIGRMVPVMTQDMQEGNVLRIWVEEYCELPIDKDAIKGGILNVPELLPFSPFEYFIRRKLFIHNMGHVITAYYGFLSDCKYISDAVRNPAIRTIAEKAMEQSALALSRKYGIDICSIREHIDNLLYRFENPLLMDTVSRVGRDPVRKLAPNDRLTGALLLCREQDCPSTYISAGIAAGLCFDANEDEKAAEVSGVVRLEGFEEALRKYCSISRDDPEYNHIKTIFDMINRKEELSNIQKKCEVL